MESRIKLVVVGLLGIGIGCAGASVSPVVSSHAQPQTTGWRCLRSRELPDTTAALEWTGNRQMEQTLNQVASHVPSGKIFNTPFKDNNLLCVKH